MVNSLTIADANKAINNIAKAIGINTSKIDLPTFLIDINSLLLIKFLNKNEIAIIVTNGMI